MIRAVVTGSSFSNSRKMRWPLKALFRASTPLTSMSILRPPVRTVAVTCELLLVTVNETGLAVVFVTGSATSSSLVVGRALTIGCASVTVSIDRISRTSAAAGKRNSSWRERLRETELCANTPFIQALKTFNSSILQRAFYHGVQIFAWASGGRQPAGGVNGTGAINSDNGCVN